MNDFKTMLLDAMNQGVSLEDVMKGISDAASAIEKERAAASKYDGYNKTVAEYFPDLEGDDVSDAIIYAKKISVHDMAVVMAHFICQNVPGYAKAMAKVDMDPIDTYTSLMKSQMAAAKVIADTQDKPDNEKEAAMFSHLLDEIIHSLNGHDSMFGGKEPRFLMPREAMRGTMMRPTQTDDQKIADFFKKAGL